MQLRLTTWLFLPAICVFALGCTRGTSSLTKPRIEENEAVVEDPEAEPIRKCFDNYRKAVIKADLDEVLKFTDTSTMPWFRDTLDLARNANRDELAGTSFSMRLCVVFLRQKFKRGELDGMKPEGAFRSFLDDVHDIPQLDLGAMHRDKDDTAIARPLGPIGAYMWSFSKINGDWKVNFKKTMEMQGEFQTSTAKQLGKSEKDLLLENVKNHMHKDVNPRILDGPLP
jgi:hypothetical protein